MEKHPVVVSLLTDGDIGRYVVYDDGVRQERGRLKRWHRDGALRAFVYVVYACNDAWENYACYTAELTNPAFLSWEERA